ncbi:MAG: hypothetical protein K2K97_10535, partial [Muribaculaceae bacterium]|nr:hypothetical protein [Muribaculaceae bacterium]
EGDDFRCSGIYYNYSLAAMPDDAKLGMKFTPEDGSDPVFVDGPDVKELPIYYGRENDQVKFPALADGTYKITPALFADSRWSEVRTPVGSVGSVTAVVKDKVATLSTETDAKVEVTDITIPAVIYAGKEFPMEFKVANTGDSEFYGDVTPYLVNDQGEVVAESVFRPVDIMPGETESVGNYVGKFSAVKDMTLSNGEYKLMFKDDKSSYDSDPVTVTIGTAPENNESVISDFRLDSTDPITDPEKVTFSFDIRCTAGYYYDAPHLYIFPGDGGYDEYSKGADRCYLTEGEHRVLNIDADLSQLKDGEYMAIIYNEGKQASDTIRFRIDKATSVIEITE